MTQCYGDDVSPESTAKEFLNAHKAAITETSGHSSKIVVDLKANFLCNTVNENLRWVYNFMPQTRDTPHIVSPVPKQLKTTRSGTKRQANYFFRY